jgi:hypothetical protein
MRKTTLLFYFNLLITLLVLTFGVSISLADVGLKCSSLFSLEIPNSEVSNFKQRKAQMVHALADSYRFVNDNINDLYKYLENLAELDKKFRMVSDDEPLRQIKIDLLEKISSLPQFQSEFSTMSYLELGKALRNAKNFIYFNNGIAMQFDPTSIQEGKSYTVLYWKGNIILGENYKAIDGTYSSTHGALAHSAKLDPFACFGGAIKFNKHGIIDVGGYNSKKPDPVAAYLIALAFRKAIPFAMIRVAPGRLTELPLIP